VGEWGSGGVGEEAYEVFILALLKVLYCDGIDRIKTYSMADYIRL
jgi:hypothetical protein